MALVLLALFCESDSKDIYSTEWANEVLSTVYIIDSPEICLKLCGKRKCQCG